MEKGVPVRVQIDVVGGELGTALVEVLIEFELIQIPVRRREVEGVVVHVGRDKRCASLIYQSAFSRYFSSSKSKALIRFVLVKAIDLTRDPCNFRLRDRHFIHRTRPMAPRLFRSAPSYFS